MPRLIIVVALTLGFAVLPSARQAALPVLTDAQKEEFLLRAKIVEARELSKGITGSVRATLSDGTLTHDAHIQAIDQYKERFQAKDRLEINFRDSWHFNVAAYRIDRLLDLQLVPVAVQRNWRSRRAAFSWWVDDVMMDEGERLEKNLSAPDLSCWNAQTRLLRLLDELIDNADRNLGNMLITNTWRIWAIDHTRAFRFSKTPRHPERLVTIDRGVLRRLEALDFKTVKQAVEGHISDADVRNLLARRDAIVERFEARGEPALYDRPDPAAGCAAPVQ
jgi:hypothetical protein